jgi:hypothetical protein
MKNTKHTNDTYYKIDKGTPWDDPASMYLLARSKRIQDGRVNTNH